jgi:hypothetical protein
MAGLLDVLNSDEGRMALGLLSAAGPQATPMSFGQRLQGAMGQQDAYLQAKKQQQAAEEERALRMQMHQFQQAQAMKQAQQQEMDTNALRGAFNQHELPGPSQDGAPVVSQFDPRGMLNGGASPQAVMQALQLQGAMQKPVDEKVLKPGEAVFRGGKMAYGLPDKPETPPEIVKLIKSRDSFPMGSPEHKILTDAINKATTHQPGTSVSVNTGQKGLDNTLKLRGDFRSEPIYKAHQEVQSAYSQIKTALDQASPASDLAAATKIMKLLDPGSVVRESELGMAMNATGMVDRLTHYASNIANGTKLTPTQRKDFRTLADNLYGESVKQYNGKRAEYQGISERNGLNVQDVLGGESPMPAAKPGNVDSLVDKYRSK